jgi:hypothetical protein
MVNQSTRAAHRGVHRVRLHTAAICEILPRSSDNGRQHLSLAIFQTIFPDDGGSFSADCVALRARYCVGTGNHRPAAGRVPGTHHEAGRAVRA